MAGPLKWTIGVPTETTGLNDAGMPTKGVTVPFKLEDGTSGSVFVPDGSFNQQNVTDLVQARATMLASIKGLTGQVQGM